MYTYVYQVIYLMKNIGNSSLYHSKIFKYNADEGPNPHSGVNNFVTVNTHILLLQDIIKKKRK
jgi:hypothetical protein